MPYVPGDTMPAEAIDLAVEIDEPLNAARASSPRLVEIKVLAAHAARLVPDGATIQSGIGEAPGAMIEALTSHKNLRVHSGLVSSEYRLLAESGALSSNTEHITGIAWGDARFYDWLPDAPFVFRSVATTHAYERLAAIPTFVSLGSALEVDLHGEINLEWLDGRRVSSVGGAPDFMMGAAASPGGRSIIALPSTTRSGRSRVVPRITRPSIPASLADAIVTEHGVAELRGLSADARAEALIAVAAPEHRDALAAARRG
jgi:acyl-CoA hydrolase